MEIRDLKYFCVTAELEHVTKAANHLGIAQPFLTRVIRGLEAELGVVLFDNIGRSIKLNKYGEALYSMSKKVVGDFENISIRMEELLGMFQYNTVFIADSQGFFPGIMSAYRKRFPENKISIAYCSRDEHAKKLISGETDFALSCPPLPNDPSRGIKTEIVFHETAVVLLPPNHSLLKKEKIKVDDLIDEPMVAPLPGSGIRNHLKRVSQINGFTPNIVCETNDSTLLMRMVLEGAGYSILAKTYVMLDSMLKKHCRPLDDEFNGSDFGLSYNTNRFSPKSDEFVTFIKEFFVKCGKL